MLVRGCGPPVWVTWLRAADDPEISGVAPVVFTGSPRPVAARPVVVVFLSVALCVWKGR
jgi:hypothetical protein